jgi:hypothetical protein
MINNVVLEKKFRLFSIIFSRYRALIASNDVAHIGSLSLVSSASRERSIVCRSSQRIHLYIRYKKKEKKKRKKTYIFLFPISYIYISISIYIYIYRRHIANNELYLTLIFRSVSLSLSLSRSLVRSS